MIEFANSPHDSRGDAAAASLRHAPAWALASINRARRLAGLPEIGSAPAVRGDGPGVWWDPDSPHRPRDAGEGHRVIGPRRGGPGPRVDRVLLVVAYGDAAAATVRGATQPETIAKSAFGPASRLNGERGWGIQCPCHDGPLIQFGGPASRGRLQAIDHDTLGLVLSWLPDPGDHRHVEAVKMIEAGAGCSVNMRIQERSTLPGVTMIRKARFVAVAITHEPAYKGAVAKVFRAVDRDDGNAFRQQLDAVAREARFRDLRSRGYAP